MINVQQFRHILVIEDNKARRIVSLEESTYSMGRDSSNSIVIYDNQVSRHHATLLKTIDETTNQFIYRIIDGNLQGNKSTNGLIINGSPCWSHELQHGDSIRLGAKAKATYQIIDRSNPSYLDLLNPSKISTQISRIKSSINEEFKKTLAREPELKNLDKEELVRLASFPELSPNPIVEIDWAGEITYVNPAAGLKFKDLHQAKLRHPILAGLVTKSQNRQGNLFVREVKIGGEVFEQYVHYLSESKLIRSYLFDFTKRKQIEAELRESEARYRALFKQTSEGIFFVDAASQQILEANAAYCHLLGYTSEEILGLTLEDVVAFEREDIIEQDLPRLLKEDLDLVGQSWHRQKDGCFITVEVRVSRICYSDKEVLCFVVRDLTTRKHLEETLEYQAFHDPLTGLPNQRLFEEKLSAAIADATRNKHLIAVMFLDLDQLKTINHTLGDEVGDRLLKGLAGRLRACLRTGDTVARWGGDDFTVLLPRIFEVKDVARISRRILDSLKQPFEIGEHRFQLKSGMGIAVYPQDGEEGPTLLKNAEAALSRTKKQGQNNYGFYSSQLNFTTSAVLKLENFLSQALEKQEFFLTYQPQIDINTGKITGMEALLRWQHPELGTLLPEKFLPLAEETGAIVAIGEWVLSTACAQNRAWQQAGLPLLPVAVNLSPRQLQQPNLVAKVAQILEKTGLEPHWLELEMTENAIRVNEEFARKVLRDLLTMGVHICMDDFGNNFCSVSYFKQIPFHTLKIARSLVRELVGNRPQDRALISAVMALRDGFNLRIVAGGVELVQQLQFLRSLQCEEIQGYYFSHPLREQEATELLKEGNVTLPNLN